MREPRPRFHPVSRRIHDEGLGLPCGGAAGGLATWGVLLTAIATYAALRWGLPSHFRKKRSNVDMVLQDARGATAHGGQLIVDALAKDFGLWEKIQACGCMDPRKDKSRGFSPEAIVG